MSRSARADLSPSRPWLLPAAFAWTVAVLAAGVAVAGFEDALRPLYGLTDPRVGPAGLGAFVAHAILCGTDRRRRIVLRAGLVLEVVRFVVVMTAGAEVDSAILSVGYGFFAAALADFFWYREWRFAVLSALVPLGMTNAAFGLSGIVRRLTPQTFDGALYVLDRAYAIPFSQLTGELFAALPLLSAVSLIAYALLPGGIAAGLGYEQYNIEHRRERGRGVNLLLAYAVSGTIAAALYVLCPATGPSHAFPGAFPSSLPDPRSVTLNLAVFAPASPRNAMPSLHVAWAILLWRSLSGARLSLRVVAGVFTALTIIATIGSGEHYVVDLVACVPFLVALEAATAHRWVSFRRRVAPFIIGLLFYAVWIIIARTGPRSIPILVESPVVIWALTVASLVLPLVVALRRGLPGKE